MTPLAKIPDMRIVLPAELSDLPERCDACLAGASVEDYNAIIPMNYQYSFLTIKDYEQTGENEGA